MMLKFRGFSCIAALLVTHLLCCRTDYSMNTLKRGGKIESGRHYLSGGKGWVFILLCLSLQVCPQFDATKSVVLKACQKKHRGPQKPYNQDANHSSFHAGGACQGAVACRFPPLTFENPEGHAVPLLDDPNCLRENAQCSPIQPRKGTAANANIQVKSPENCGELAVEQDVLSPSDAEAAQVPSPRNGRCSSTLSPSSHAWHPEEELPFGTDPCGRGEAAAVLVTDTPEHEYGVKVTWRRRPHVMRYLREQGKLSAADILVKASFELSRRQAHS